MYARIKKRKKRADKENSPPERYRRRVYIMSTFVFYQGKHRFPWRKTMFSTMETKWEA